MDNERYGIRATSEYAIYQGREYLAWTLRERVRLFSDDEQLPAPFTSSSRDWVRAQALVPKESVEKVFRVRTTCTWRGHRFTVGLIVGDSAYVDYLGVDFDGVCGLPGLSRPDKYEVQGVVPVSELEDVEEAVEVPPSAPSITDALKSKLIEGCGLSYPYAQDWRNVGYDATRNLRTVPYDGLRILGARLPESKWPVFASSDRLIMPRTPGGCWVVASRNSTAPDTYLVGAEHDRSPGYIGDSAEVVAEIVRYIMTGARYGVITDEIQIGFPGHDDAPSTYVGSWQWNVHGEAFGDKFVNCAASATQAAIDAKRHASPG